MEVVPLISVLPLLLVILLMFISEKSHGLWLWAPATPCHSGSAGLLHHTLSPAMSISVLTQTTRELTIIPGFLASNPQCDLHLFLSFILFFFCKKGGTLKASCPLFPLYNRQLESLEPVVHLSECQEWPEPCCAPFGVRYPPPRAASNY